MSNVVPYNELATSDVDSFFRGAGGAKDVPPWTTKLFQHLLLPATTNTNAKSN